MTTNRPARSKLLPNYTNSTKSLISTKNSFYKTTSAKKQTNNAIGPHYSTNYSTATVPSMLKSIASSAKAPTTCQYPSRPPPPAAAVTNATNAISPSPARCPYAPASSSPSARPASTSTPQQTRKQQKLKNWRPQQSRT
jgi:hypothetical protein